MKNKFILGLLVIILVVSFSMGISASIFDWKVYESDYFVIFFPEGYKYQAEEVLYYLEKYRQETMDLVGNKNDFKSLVILQDAGLESNGAAAAVNYKIYIYTNNPSTLSRMEGLEGYNSWFKQVSIHELTHLAQMSNSSGFAGSLVNIGGAIFSPNLYTPGWMQEGIAVYNESKYSQYEGRLNNGYYESFIASRAKSGDFPDLLAVSNGNNEYIYGAKFIDYLADIYGEEKLTAYFKEHSDNIWNVFGMIFPTLGIDNSAKKVYGKSFPELFKEWQEYEIKQYQDWNINATEIVENKEGKISKLTKYKDKLYYIKEEICNPAPFFKFSRPVIMEYDLKSKKENEIDTLNTSTNASLQVIDDKIYYSTKVSGVGILKSYNLQTGETNNHSFGLFKDYVVLANNDIYYVKDADDGFGSEIWKYTDIVESDDKIKKIGKTNQLISEIVAYQDKFIVVSKKRFGSWNINYLEKDNNKENYILKEIINSPYLEKSIKVDGDRIYFTTNYNNNYAIYQYDLILKELTKATSVSYASDGIVRDNKLYFVGVTDQGEAIYQTELKSSKYPAPQKEILEEVDMEIVSKEDKTAFFKNLSYLFKPYIRFPYLQGEDALGFLSYRISYFDDFETVVAKETYGYDYKSYSLCNYKSDVDNTRQTSLQIHYENDNYESNTILGRDVFYFDGSRVIGKNFKNSSLTAKGTAVYGSSEYGIDFIPGEAGYEEVMGLKEELEYTHKLIEMQKGMWNPNIFISNIFGNASIGYYNLIMESTKNYDPYYPYPDGEESGSTYLFSYELLPEVSMGFNEKMIPALGVRYYSKENGESGLNTFVNYYINFSFFF